MLSRATLIFQRDGIQGEIELHLGHGVTLRARQRGFSSAGMDHATTHQGVRSLAGSAMADIDLHQLEQTYGELRIASPVRQRRLLATLAVEGQQSPVLVVEGGDGHYVLIDGYQRVAALEALGRDTVSAIVLPYGEAEALVQWHRQARTTRRSVMEDAWLLRALTEQHGLGQPELARRLGHTTSWVSRWLGLVTALPETVQELVRAGLLSSYSATKYLVPLARANAVDCEKLA